MSKPFIAAALIFLAAPALAAPNGTWDRSQAYCTAEYTDSRVAIDGSNISFHESSCSLDNPTSLRDMPEGQLYDVNCSGEGMTWTDRAFIASNGSDGLLIYMRGHASTYERCGG